MLYETYFFRGGEGWGGERCSIVVPEKSSFLFRNVVEQTTRTFMELF